MLEPKDRNLYLEALRPPSGYGLSRAVGTTYSVDPLSLLAVPLAFAQADWGDAREDLIAEPTRLLRSLREFAGKVTLFCQVGRVIVPDRAHPLLAFLESMVVEAAVPSDGGEFHPKTWLLRFEASPDDPVVYRFLCLSRNLTDDRSWDTVLALEGEVQDRQRAIAANHPLAEFIEALPALALREMSEGAREEIRKMAAEVRKVRFDPPEDFDEVKFFPMGIEGHEGVDLEANQASRMVVVSPFLTKGFLDSQAVAAETVLVSRQESLDELEPSVLEPFKKIFVLDDGAYLDAQGGEAEPVDSTQESPTEAEDPRGLHAKLYVVERGWDVDVLTGSANATTAAFERNVEFLVQLTGKKSKVGVRALLGEEGPKNFSFGSLLVEYKRGARPVEDTDEARANEKTVDRARRAISRWNLELQVRPSSAEGLFDVDLTVSSPARLEGSVRARCWLASQREGSDWNVERLLRDRKLTFERLSIQQLTAFLCVEVEVGTGDALRGVRFARVLPLEGAPENRMEAVLAGVLQQPERFLRFLLFLLQDPEVDPVAIGELVAGLDGWPAGLARQPGPTPLLEELLRISARAPERLREVQALVEDLKRSPDGMKVLPPGFEAVWNPIWEGSGVKA